MANWAQMNVDILEEIAKRIKLYEDFVAFSCVCTSWRWAAPKKNFIFQSSQMPWLMLSQEEGSDLRSFYSLSSGKFCPLILKEASDHKCFSSRGWLIIIDKNLNISLFEPFSRFHIELPHMKTFIDYEELELGIPDLYALGIDKCLLSGNPSTSNYTLLVIYGSFGKLAFCKSGFKSWITIPLWQACYSDIIYYKEQFYAINVLGQVVVVDIKCDNAVVAHQVVDMSIERNQIYVPYLVELEGKLLVVLRRRVAAPDDTHTVTHSFKVFEIELSTNTWIEVKYLGNKAVILGHNSSLSIEAFEFSGCKGNCIYFTGDYAEENYNFAERGGIKDMGIYHLEDGRIEPHYDGDSFHHITPPLWVEKIFL